MKRIVTIACALALGFATAPAAMAQFQSACGNGQQNCQPQNQQRKGGQQDNRSKGQPRQQQVDRAPNRQNVGPSLNDRRPQNGPSHVQNGHRPQQQTATGFRAPQVGHSARGGQRFQQARTSRLPRPPYGQEYRVIDNTVVRVDSRTLQIVAIVGLLGAVLGN